MDEVQLKLQQLQLMQERLDLKEGLPHLYGLNLYQWQIDFMESKFRYRNRFACAANQIGKSTVQIIDRVCVATEPELWPQLWPGMFAANRNTKPFSWYLYPNQDTVMSEFEEKWVPSYLPRGKYESHPVYGWKKTINNKVLKKIDFNSGWTIYFKTYNQNVSDLQSGTVFAIDCDEELPEHLLPELQARLISTDGYFSKVFTATLGQDIWRKCIEPTPSEKESGKEVFPDAYKKQISLYDCTKYANGEPSIWTPSRIRGAEARCKDKREIDRRIRGKFVVSTGLKYAGFERERNYKPFPMGKDGKRFKGVPKGWHVYTGIDWGSGGEDNHPSAYTFIMVNPTYTKLRAFKTRRLDGIETTAKDLWKFYKRSRGSLMPVAQAYDSAAKDFGTITGRLGESFNKAKKDHELGEMALDTALKTGMLVIYYDPDDDQDESHKLVGEFESLKSTTPKRIAKDDAIDSCRYCIMEIPIDWEAILDNKPQKEAKLIHESGTAEKERPDDYWQTEEERNQDKDIYDEEFSEWNDLLD